MDSPKRRSQQVEFQVGFQADESEENHLFGIQDSLLSEVSIRDLVGLLSQYLSNDERAVLHCLPEGLGPREIGRRLKMSHTMALRHRSRIAEVLTRLDNQKGEQRRTLAKSVPPPKKGDCRKLALSHYYPYAKPDSIFAQHAVPVLRAA